MEFVAPADAVCEVHLQVEERAARIGEAERWRQLGGFKMLEKMNGLPAEEQARIIDMAISSGKTVGAVLNGGAQRTDRASARRDAEALAQFIDDTAEKIPRRIEDILTRYIARQQRKAA